MYKTCSKCKKLTEHDFNVDKHNGKKIFTCKVCGTKNSSLSMAQRAILEEKRSEMYKEKTFADLLNRVRQDMNND